ncbi:hypothetical protein TSMEX_010083 [Taenia solium]|eukprot:TsM_001130300 transcript=TsM_001130300 gene=TsM_001130300
MLGDVSALYFCLKTSPRTCLPFLPLAHPLSYQYSTAFQAAEEAKLTKEAGKQYDTLVAILTDYMKADGEATFAQLTASLLPCEEAHAAYNAAIGVTCGESGGVRLLIGLSYVLALNVLFLTFLYFALLVLAFFQALQIRMLSEMAGAMTSTSFPNTEETYP